MDFLFAGNMSSIFAENLSKSYGKIKAVEGISLSVEKAEIFGLIGADGAGKTTLFRILTTLLIPDRGVARIEGLDVLKDYKKIRRIAGYMPGRFSLYQDLSVEENLQFYASIFNTGIEENYHLIRDIYQQIAPFKKRLAGNLSGGMKQKLALSCALIHSPEVLFLDEPTTGVDAVSRMEFWEMLKELQKKNITILVSTPYMDEAKLCDRVALMQKGKLLNVDTPENIIESYDKPLRAVTSDDMFKLPSDLENFEGSARVFRFGDSIHLTLKTDDISEKNIAAFLSEKGHDNIRIEKIKPGIEDCFMAEMIEEG